MKTKGTQEPNAFGFFRYPRSLIPTVMENHSTVANTARQLPTMNQNIQNMMTCSVNGLGINYSLGKQYVGDFPPQENTSDLIYRPSQTYPNTIWDFWEKIYYPEVIKVGYPVYLQERAMDKGSKAYEILKVLIDKKIVKLDKVSDFVEAMDCLIKAL